MVDMSLEGFVVDVGWLCGLFHQFNFLKVTKEIESLIVTSLITCFPNCFVALLDLGGWGVTD